MVLAIKCCKGRNRPNACCACYTAKVGRDEEVEELAGGNAQNCGCAVTGLSCALA
jgi:hypothetical protein